MQITRITDARRYDAPEHFDMACLRLQGKEATATQSMWMGMSTLLPGGHTSLKASPQEKLYIVISGHVTLGNGKEDAVLGPLDSCAFAPGEARALRNDTDLPATVLLIMQEGL
ncbi:cupin domain-containing protein [Pseudotabrizicola sediminis]|uniref:Cupin domain-containing protein n=1 Tax=Pseudotabrizicola sediminis TaxID=2486418 RepID=A0ABY2KJA7_9RHOB|nr:cupin domain-containing protein [Pseudotabrizicola sediminis]TGD42486.1 cupin domain-containing protein [Pseudotabrizicola sediminis]TGD65219.1 cupin domain-containing protein [Tabrizicola sp. WMC-M-20]